MLVSEIPFLSELFLSDRALADAPQGDPRFVPGQTFQIAKTGTFFSPVYGKITLGPQELVTMFRNFKTRTPLPPTQLPIDYDHLSDDPKKPEDGKAAGWVEDLEIRDGGNTLWARPKWTKRAAQLIAEGAYRWCSPYFLVDYLDKMSGQKIGPTLKAVAITNRPFLEGMGEIPAPAIAMTERVAAARAEVIPTNDADYGCLVMPSDESVRGYGRPESDARAFSEVAAARSRISY